MLKSEQINLDCLEGMKSLPSSSVSYVITSPPYNLGEGMEDKGGLRIGHGGSFWKNSILQNGYASFDDALPYPIYVRWQRAVLHECWRLLDDAGAIFYNHKPRIVKGKLRLPTVLARKSLPLRQVIIWDRASGFNYNAAAYLPVCEWILVYAKPNFRLKNKSASSFGDIWRFPADINTEHPAPFPYELPARVLQSVKPITKPVLDPFAGSGTTRIAAHDFGYEFIGYDIDEGYCKMSDERFQRHIATPKLFQPEPATTQAGLF